MTRLLLPAVTYAALSALYLGGSGAPLRVQWLSLAVLAIAVLIPSLWAAHVARPRHRLAISGSFSLIALLLWDATAHAVIAKVDAFSMLSGAAWVYAVGGIALTLASFGIAWASAPPVTKPPPGAR